MAQLIRFMDRMGIERVMLSLGYPLLEDPPPQQLREQTIRCCDAFGAGLTARSVSCT